MKIFRVVIVILAFLFLANSSFATESSYLYLLKNTTLSQASQIVEFYLNGLDAQVKTDSGKFLVYPKKKSDESDVFHVIILKPAEENIYLYYYASDKTKAFDDILKKRFKAKNISYKTVRNSSLKDIFLSSAKEFNHSSNIKAKIVYDFSDEAQAKFDAKKPASLDMPELQTQKKSVSKTNPSVNNTQINNGSTQQRKLLKGHVVQIPEGASFNVNLQSTINSQSLASNDAIAATLTEDWYYNDMLIAPKNSVVYGVAVDTRKAGLAYKNGQLGITFNELLTPNGQKINLSTNTVMLKVDASRALKITGNVLCGAVMGLLTGTVYTLISGGNVAKGLAIGAAAGAAGGSLFAVSRTGQDVELPAGTKLNIRLIKTMTAELDG